MDQFSIDIGTYIVLGLSEEGIKEVLGIYVGQNESTIDICPLISRKKIIYTTNAIESLNTGYRRLNKGKTIFQGDAALLKALWLATQRISKKWNHTARGWGSTIAELKIMADYPVD